MLISGQLDLFARTAGPEGQLEDSLAGLERRELPAGAWVDYLSGWLRGDAHLMAALAASTRWQEGERQMYDRVVAVPRLVAGLPADGPGHPLIERMRAALDRHYGVAFARTGLAYYRGGTDSVAWHGDYIARELDQAIVATVSLGQPRRFLLRPKPGGGLVGKSIAYRLGWGDLIVMGGTCQRTWQHCIPKVAHADPRMVIMFRPVWDAPPGAYRPPGY